MRVQSIRDLVDCVFVVKAILVIKVEAFTWRNGRDAGG